MHDSLASPRPLHGPSPTESMTTFTHTDNKSEKLLTKDVDGELGRTAASVTECPVQECEGICAPDTDPGKSQERWKPEGDDASVIPEDKRLEALERIERDWALDPANPRNWTFWRKWRVAGAVRS